MRKIFHGALLMFAAALFVACDTQNTPEPPTPEHQNNEFAFENIATRHTRFIVDIRPEDKEMEYVVLFAEKKHLMMNNIDTREELLEHDRQYIEELARKSELSVEEFLSDIGWLAKGDMVGYGAVDLYPDTEYVVYCYGVSIEGDSYEATTPVNYTVMRTTTPEFIDVKFDIEGSAGSRIATININPIDYNGLYYSYIVDESDSYFVHEGMEVTNEHIEHYRNRAYDEFNELINIQGLHAGAFCHNGAVTLKERLQANTKYQVVLFAVSDEPTPLLCSKPAIYNFATSDSATSDLKIDIKVTDITPYTAQLTLTPSNNNDTYACVFLSRSQVPSYEDEYDQMVAIINDYMPSTFTGSWSEQLMPLMPNSEYSVLAFGIDEEMPTTELFRYDFTSASAAEGKIKIESINLLKLFDAQEIIALDASYAYKLGECECVAIVEAKTSAPTDKIYYWWYEEWMKVEYSDEAFLEDLLLYDYTPSPTLMDMYYSMSSDDAFFFAGIAEDEEGNMSPLYFGEAFTLSTDDCSPAEEFFNYVGTRSANIHIFAR